MASPQEMRVQIDEPAVAWGRAGTDVVDAGVIGAREPTTRRLHTPSTTARKMMKPAQVGT